MSSRLRCGGMWESSERGRKTNLMNKLWAPRGNGEKAEAQMPTLGMKIKQLNKALLNNAWVKIGFSREI